MEVALMPRAVVIFDSILAHEIIVLLNRAIRLFTLFVEK
jgi:hypothetical protein